MDQQAKFQLQAKLVTVNALINTAKGMANTPASPNVPIFALNPIVSALQELHATMKMLIDKA